MFVEGFGDIEILDHRWYSVPNYANVIGGERIIYEIGIVTIKNAFNEVKSYIGITPDRVPDLEADIKFIVQAGVPYFGE